MIMKSKVITLYQRMHGELDNYLYLESASPDYFYLENNRHAIISTAFYTIIFNKKIFF